MKTIIAYLSSLASSVCLTFGLARLAEIFTPAFQSTPADDQSQSAALACTRPCWAPAALNCTAMCWAPAAGSCLPCRAPSASMCTGPCHAPSASMCAIPCAAPSGAV